MARPAVFDGKDRKSRPIQGIMTPAGVRAFEQARRDLATMYARVMGREIANVSDGDTAEYLARGRAETMAYLKQKRAKVGR